MAIDPEQERRRLAAFYSQQMDGELEKVAGTAYELTDWARQELKAELARRGLTPRFVEQAPVVGKEPSAPKPGDPPPPDPPEERALLDEGEFDLREMITIRRFRDLPEALLAKGSLDSAEIRCTLVDDNMVRLDWFISNLIGGVKLQVYPEDAEAANEVLSQPIPENFDVFGVGEYKQPHCPRCNSLDVTFQELNRPISYATLWLRIPIPVYRRAWRCHDCKLEWEDDVTSDSKESSA